MLNVLTRLQEGPPSQNVETGLTVATAPAADPQRYDRLLAAGVPAKERFALRGDRGAMDDLLAELKRLRLYGMATCYIECVKQGNTGGLTTHESLLTHLVQAETTDRTLRSMCYQMHVARFPIHRDLTGFDFEQSKVDRRQIPGYATTEFTGPAENIMLIGGTGTGKSHLATALLDRLTHHCHIV